MIRVKVSQVRDGLQLELRDHATGEPLVCAGASAIVWALAGWLKNHHEAEPVMTLRAGDAFLQCARTPEAEVAFELAVVGLMQLERTYPEAVWLERAEGTLIRSFGPPSPCQGEGIGQGRMEVVQ